MRFDSAIGPPIYARRLTEPAKGGMRMKADPGAMDRRDRAQTIPSAPIRRRT